MTTTLTTEQHVAALRVATDKCAEFVREAGAAAPVPTCPTWTVRDLVVHLGTVHRWATGALHGQRVDRAAVAAEGQTAELADWLRAGVDDLTAAIDRTPPDAEGFVFFVDTPPFRAFWARRQCHETLIHAVDALAATQGTVPAPSHDWITADIAVDGIDEILCGILPDPRGSFLRTGDRTSLAVAPDDSPFAWSLSLSTEAPVTTRMERSAAPAAAFTMTGPASAVYLQLWNRATGADNAGLMPEWPTLAKV